jgi:general secretion pathway protein G
MKNKGFTLIELLAVMVILSIIMMIAIPGVNNLITQNRVKVFYEIAEAACDALKYEINSGKAFNLKEPGDKYSRKIANLSMQKDSRISPFDANWVDEKSYVVATREDDNSISYHIYLEDGKGNCLNADYFNIRNNPIIEDNCNIPDCTDCQ